MVTLHQSDCKFMLVLILLSARDDQLASHFVQGVLT